MSRTIAEALNAGAARLSDAGIEDARGDMTRLLELALDLPRGRLMLHMQDALTDAAEAVLLPLVEQRRARVPLSHLRGTRAFWGRDFIVTGDVLDPRSETETLIAAALDGNFDGVLDLGTGSGCILLTLLAERGTALGTGADLSPAALDVAARNASALGVCDRCTLVQSDWFAALSGRFDLIVSNPPYIAQEEMPALAPELLHEPRMALTDEGDGLSAYRVLTAGAGGFLRSGGRLLLEIGFSQGAAVAQMTQAAGFSDVRILTDLDGRDRVISGIWP